MKSTCRAPDCYDVDHITIFGIGSIGGMVIMSTLFSLPGKLTSFSFVRLNILVGGLAGIVSLCLGVFMVYDTALALISQTNNS